MSILLIGEHNSALSNAIKNITRTTHKMKTDAIQVDSEASVRSLINQPHVFNVQCLCVVSEETRFNPADLKKTFYKLQYIDYIENTKGENKLDFADLVDDALAKKANLTIEYCTKSQRFRLFDPLGNIWCNYTDDLNLFSSILIDRFVVLRSVSRVSTTCIGTDVTTRIPKNTNNDQFLTIIHNAASIYQELINPSNDPKRFLGNAAFRCQRGFPSLRHHENKDIIFVSKRNVDKNHIGPDDFVPIRLTDNVHRLMDTLAYYGDNKPSVDSPIQALLFKRYPNVNYIIHSHTYVDTEYVTKNAVPCGALEEFEEIVEAIGELAIDEDVYNISINLKGHGSMIMAKDLDYFSKVNHIKRDLPEVQHIIYKFGVLYDEDHLLDAIDYAIKTDKKIELTMHGQKIKESDILIQRIKEKRIASKRVRNLLDTIKDRHFKDNKV